MGRIPGAAFRNLDYIEDACSFDDSVDYNTKMFLVDAQTSGGILMCVKREYAEEVLEKLKASTYPASSIVGEVSRKEGSPLINVSS